MTATGNHAGRTEPSEDASTIAGLSPGYFALVMATGIVSLAVNREGMTSLAMALFGLNLGAYVVLWVLTLVRLVRFRRRFIEELTHHSRGSAFLTTAIGTCILGAQFAILMSRPGIAAWFWVAGSVLGLALSYTFFAAITFCEPKPSLAAGINGAWLLNIVTLESISVLGTLVADRTPWAEMVRFISLATFLVGAMLYMFFATLIMYRWLFFRMKPERLTPDYWIDMGALAATTLAGAVMLQSTGRGGLYDRLGPFMAGSTCLFWAAATWWIPLLLTVELWRHLRGRVLFKYGPDYWALVFPLGMYAAATKTLAGVGGLAFLNGIARVFTYIALAAWIIVFAGMLHSLARVFFRRR